MKNSRKLLLASLCGLAAVGIYACGSTGQQGEPGAAGAKGDSCSVITNADGTATIKCTDGSSFNIVNGEDGQPGDAGSDGKDGQDGKSCYLTENSDGSAAVVCPYDGSSFIVRGNTDNYANYCKKGFWGKNCENECNCNEHQDCNDGVTGDGSCSCVNGYYGAACNIDCSKGAEGSYFGMEECTYTDTRDTNSEVIYPLVKIGNQIWMAENLKATKDINGNDVTCYANTDKDADFVKKYGCLYTWEDAMKVCPAGWRLPDKGDFEQLLTTTGASGDTSIIRASSWKNGSDSSGFGALPAGLWDSNGPFVYFGYFAYFWSATPKGSVYAYGLDVGSDNARVGYSSVDLAFYLAFSVRCLKDEG